jgi:hypothetical protein
VLFGDVGELLACLLLALAEDTLTGRWYWQALLGPAYHASFVALASFVGERAVALPAAFSLLDDIGQGEAVLEHCPNSVAHAWRAAVSTAFALPQLSPAGVSAIGHQVGGTSEIELRLAGENRALGFGQLADKIARGQFSRLAYASRALLVICRALVRAPTLARRTSFLAGLLHETQVDLLTGDALRHEARPKVAHDHQTVSSTALQRGSAIADRLAQPPSPPLAHTVYLPEATGGEPRSPVPSEACWPEDEAPSTADRSSRPPADEQATLRRPGPVPETASFSGGPSPGAVEQGDAPADESAVELADLQPCYPEQAAASGRQALAEGYVDTRIGGVLYLINLMSDMALLTAFAPFWRIDEQLSPWGLLELLGRGIIDDPADDPLWRLLARLDGREAGVLPGERFCGSGDWLLPRCWLADVRAMSRQLRYALAQGRLRIWSVAGIPLADIGHRGGGARARALALVREFGFAPGAHVRRAPCKAAPQAGISIVGQAELDRQSAATLLGWLVPTLALVRQRLALAMAVAPWAVPQELRLAARVYYTRAHIDMVAHIDDVSLPARLAGLDRDPGWQPDLGRVIQFHFAARSEAER